MWIAAAGGGAVLLGGAIVVVLLFGRFRTDSEGSTSSSGGSETKVAPAIQSEKTGSTQPKGDSPDGGATLKLPLPSQAAEPWSEPMCPLPDKPKLEEVKRPDIESPLADLLKKWQASFGSEPSVPQQPEVEKRLAELAQSWESHAGLTKEEKRILAEEANEVKRLWTRYSGSTQQVSISIYERGDLRNREAQNQFSLVLQIRKDIKAYLDAIVRREDWREVQKSCAVSMEKFRVVLKKELDSGRESDWKPSLWHYQRDGSGPLWEEVKTSTEEIRGRVLSYFEAQRKNEETWNRYVWELKSAEAKREATDLRRKERETRLQTADEAVRRWNAEADAAFAANQWKPELLDHFEKLGSDIRALPTTVSLKGYESRFAPIVAELERRVRSQEGPVRAMVAIRSYNLEPDVLFVTNLNGYAWTGVTVTLNGEFHCRLGGIGRRGFATCAVNRFRNKEGVVFGYSNYRGIQSVAVHTVQGEWKGTLSQE